MKIALVIAALFAATLNDAITASQHASNALTKAGLTSSEALPYSSDPLYAVGLYQMLTANVENESGMVDMNAGLYAEAVSHFSNAEIDALSAEQTFLQVIELNQ